MQEEQKRVKAELYTVENARTAQQAALMQQGTLEKKCFFCQIDMSVNRPLNRRGEFDPEGKDWPLLWVWENPFPQEHQSHHIMILPKRHIRNEEWHLITDEEWLQILDARKWACQFYGIKGGGGIDRFGERFYNAGTVDHWHYQLQVPDGSGPVKATFFKDYSPENVARRANRKIYTKKDLTRVKGYAVRNKHGEFLTDNFRWNKTEFAFVHVPEALPFIRMALGGWNELDGVTAQEAEYAGGRCVPLASAVELKDLVLL